MTYAFGSRSWAICDRCGRRVRYTEIQIEWTAARVCDECYEDKHPQLDPQTPPADAEALYDARPDRIEPMEVIVGSTFPSVVNNLQAITSVGEVTVSTP